MSISIDYKQQEIQRIIDILIQKSNMDLVMEPEFVDDDSEIIDDFDFDLYKILQTPIERMRYFVLYDLKDKNDINIIIEQLFNDINSCLHCDHYLLLKTLLKLFQYDVDQIPSNFEIYSILKDSILDEN